MKIVFLENALLILEIVLPQAKGILFGTFYRAPSQMDFMDPFRAYPDILPNELFADRTFCPMDYLLTNLQNVKNLLSFLSGDDDSFHRNENNIPLRITCAGRSVLTLLIIY